MAEKWTIDKQHPFDSVAHFDIDRKGEISLTVHEAFLKYLSQAVPDAKEGQKLLSDLVSQVKEKVDMRVNTSNPFHGSEENFEQYCKLKYADLYKHIICMIDSIFEDPQAWRPERAKRDNAEHLLGLVQGGKYDEAIRDAEEVLGSGKKYEEFMNLVLGDLVTKVVAARQSDSFEDLLYLARCMIKIGERIDLPDQIHALGWYLEGVGLASLGHFQDGIASFAKAIELEPDGAIACESWRDQGGAYFQLHRRRRAMECVDRAIDLSRKPGNEAFRKSAEDLRDTLRRAV